MVEQGTHKPLVGSPNLPLGTKTKPANASGFLSHTKHADDYLYSLFLKCLTGVSLHRPDEFCTIRMDRYKIMDRIGDGELFQMKTQGGDSFCCKISVWRKEHLMQNWEYLRLDVHYKYA